MVIKEKIIIPFEILQYLIPPLHFNRDHLLFIFFLNAQLNKDQSISTTTNYISHTQRQLNQ